MDVPIAPAESNGPAEIASRRDRTPLTCVLQRTNLRETTAVAAAARDYGDVMIPEYLVGFDDNAAARAATDFTRALAHDTGAHVVAAHVYPVLAGTYASPYGAAAPFGMIVDPEAEEEARAAAARLLKKAGDDVEQRALRGESVPRELRALARSGGAALLVVGATHRGRAGRLLTSRAQGGIDLLITGSRGYGPLRSVLPGATSRHIVDHAPCPVLVVPRGTTASLVADEAEVATT